VASAVERMCAVPRRLPVVRGLHSLTAELNLRTFGTHRSRESST